jgi:hypothetical protein
MPYCIEKFVSRAKTSWPWGRVKCVVNIRLKRETLNRAMTAVKFEAVLDPHIAPARLSAIRTRPTSSSTSRLECL